jgi:hypothetical protein
MIFGALPLANLNAVRSDAEPADIRRMRHAPRLDDKKLTFKVMFLLDVPYSNPAVHQGRDIQIRLIVAFLHAQVKSRGAR